MCQWFGGCSEKETRLIQRFRADERRKDEMISVRKFCGQDAQYQEKSSITSFSFNACMYKYLEEKIFLSLSSLPTVSFQTAASNPTFYVVTWGKPPEPDCDRTAGLQLGPVGFAWFGNS